ncbi:MAG: ankyrin repeat domain-containing protein [Tepidisphaeraceae bacterium]
MNVSSDRKLVAIVGITVLLTTALLWFISQPDDGAFGQGPKPAAPDPKALALYEAIDAADLARITTILDTDPDLLKYRFGMEGTVLHVAARRNRVDVVRLLVHRGAQLTARGQWNGTPLHWACWWGAKDAATELLRLGSELEDKGDAFGSTPLLWACHGSSNNLRSMGGDFAGTVRMLLANGADGATTNAQGVPAAAMANNDVADILRAHGVAVPPPGQHPAPGSPGATTRPDKLII